MRRVNIFLLILALSLPLCSCGTAQYLKGKSFEKNEQYEGAIDYYEKALDKKPDCAKYKQALDRAKNDYARVITKRASDFLSSRHSNLETLDEALTLLEKATNLGSGYAGAEDLKRQVIQEREALYVKFNDLIRSKDISLEKHEWDNALEVLSKAIEIEPRDESLRVERGNIIGKAYAYYWQISQDYHSKGQYGKALSAVDKALKYGNPEEASAFREKMVKAVKAEELYEEAQIKLQEKKLDASVPVLKEVLSLNDEKEEARIALANVYYTKGNEAYKRGNLLDALAYYQQALKWRDPYPYRDLYSNLCGSSEAVKDLVGVIESKIAEICLHRVKEYSSSDLHGNAMLYVKACKKCLDHPSFKNLINRNQKEIEASFLWPTFSILDFSRGARSKRRSTYHIKAEVMIPDQINRKMESRYSAHIRPRDNVIDSLYELGINLEYIREWNEKKLERLSSVIDSKFIIAGNIFEFDIDKTERRESKTKRYVAGTRNIPNPEYSQWLAHKTRVDDCNARRSSRAKSGMLLGLLTKNKSLFARGLAAGSGSCGSYGPAPRQYLKETVYRDCNYEVYDHEIKGSITTKYLVYDRDTGRLLIDKNETTTYRKSDRETTGCKVAGIEEDPFDLPTEEEVAEQLIQNNAASFFELLRHKILGELPQMYLKIAENQEDSLYQNEYFAVANLICPDCTPVEDCFKDYCEQVRENLTNDEFSRLTQKEFLTEETSKGRKWALIIGINRYQDSYLMNLKFAQKDAVVIGRTLIRKCGFPQQNVKMLLGASAKRSEILAAINKIAQDAMPEDMVVIYFAGHGGFENDRSQPDGYRKYLLPYDSDKRQSFYATAISYDEIASFFGKIRSNRLICFLDACYSGAAGGRDFLEGMTRSVRVIPTHLEELSEGKGRIIIAASDGNQPSLELYEKQHGIFTYFLVKGLDGEADLEPQDGKVTLLELFEYVSGKVQEETSKKGTSQEPIMKGEMGGGQIILSLVSHPQ